MTLTPEEQWYYDQQVANHPQDSQDGPCPGDLPWPGDDEDDELDQFRYMREWRIP